MSNEFKLVPVEPTCEMLQAGVKVSGVLLVYEAMLANAPQPPALGCVHLPSIQDDGIEGVGYNKGLRDAAAAIEAAGYPISNDPRSKVVGV